MTAISRAGHCISAALVAATAIAFYGCAQQGAPQGGPPDTTPPAVDTTAPASGDVLVPRNAGLSIQFSEPIDRAAFEVGLQVSPARTGPAKFEWSNGSRRVDILWPDSLRDSTSYRVTLSNRIADRRGNKLPEPITFAFSTGSQVDRGEIRGFVHASREKSGAFDVFAYRQETLSDTFWLSTPDYFTQTAAEGRFQLPFLRAGNYRVVVLTDANRNQRLDHGEQFALATHDFTVADELPPDSADWFPTVYDTVPFELRSCSLTGPGVITLNFSHPPDTSGSSSWQIDVHDSATGLPIAASRLNPTIRRPSALSLTGNWTVGAVYQITAANLVDQRGETLMGDTCYAKYDLRADSVSPRIEKVTLPTADAAMTPAAPIIWVFTEPVDTTMLTGAVSVSDTIGSAVSGTPRWIDAQTLSFAPESSWVDTVVMIATIDSTRLTDAAGNTAASGTYSWRFAPLGEARMGVVEIRIETSESIAADIWLEARSLSDSRMARALAVGAGIVPMTLPSGRWHVSGFVDSNRDGRWFPGTVSPFAFCEQRAVCSDTIDVRARFTLEDVVLKF